jgi:hypothetical protein
LLASGVSDEEGVADVPTDPIFGMIAITVFVDRAVRCKQESKISGLETLPDLAPILCQIKEFLGLCRLELNDICR